MKELAVASTTEYKRKWKEGCRLVSQQFAPPAEAGMKPIIEKMLEQSILREVLGSPCNSSVMAIKKPHVQKMG